MPTYEYRCPEGHLFEKFQKMSDKPRAKCPTCGKTATRQISGGAGLVFKGSGFYITDYRSDSYKNSAKADSGSAGSATPSKPSTDTKPVAKSESAPAPKSESKPGKKMST